MNGISNGDGTYRQLSDSDALVGKSSDLPYPSKSIAENIGDVEEVAFGNGIKLVKVGRVVTVVVPNSPSWWFHDENSIPSGFIPRDNLLYFPVWDVNNNVMKQITVANGKFNAQSFYYTLLSGTSWIV